MSVIQDWYRGHLIPVESFGYPSDQIYADLVEDNQKITDGFVSGLSEKEQKVFAEINQNRAELCNMELERMFLYAFKLGVAFGAEIFKE